MLCPMSVGATSVLYPERPTPQTVFETLRAYQPTMFFAVPTLYAAMLADPECKPEYMSSRLRLCFSAGEPLPAHVGEAWKQRFDVDIVNGVGSTEMGHLFLTNLPDAVEYGTSGVPVDGYDLRLVDENGQDVADNEIGEMLVRGESSAAGYWNQREKSRRTFVGRVDCAPATNTFGGRTASTPTAAAPTTCSRSAAFGFRRSRSRTRWSPTRRCSRPRSCRSKTITG